MTVALLDRHTDNDPLNKTDPLGLRPDDDGEPFEPSPVHIPITGPEQCDLTNLASIVVDETCSIGSLPGGMANVNGVNFILGWHPVRLTCSSNSVDPNYLPPASADISVVCDAVFGKRITALMRFLAFSPDPAGEVCSNSDFDLSSSLTAFGDSIRNDPLVSDTSALPNTCRGWYNAVEGDMVGRANEAYQAGECLSLRIRISGSYPEESNAEHFGIPIGVSYDFEFFGGGGTWAGWIALSLEWKKAGLSGGCFDELFE